MTLLERFLIGMTGHNGSPRGTWRSDDFVDLPKIGAAIPLAALLGGVNAGVASWEFGRNLDHTSRLVLAMFAAAFGAMLVLVVDRAAIWFADTQLKISRPLLASFIAVRVAIILCISAFTSQAVMPVLLRSELKAHSLQMREERERKRTAELEQRYSLAEKGAQQQRMEEAVERQEERVNNLPPHIRQRLAAGERCWTDYASRRQQLVAVGIVAEDLRQRLAPYSVRCVGLVRSAERERDEHRRDQQQRLVQLREASKVASTEAMAAKTAARSAVDEASAIDKEAIGEHSADVLADLLARNPGARWKWLLLTALQVMLELLPLLIKLSAGQSAAGLAVATQRAQRADELHRRRAKQCHDDELENELRAASLTSARELAGSQEVRAALRESYTRILVALAPMEGVNAFLRQIAEEQDRVMAAMARHPQHAERIGRAWADALEQAVASLRSGRATPA